MSRELPSIEYLRRNFRVDQEWRLERHRASGGWERCSKKRGGSEYFTVCLGGAQHMAHRIIWALHYGRHPEGMLDHANGCPWDNRIENLREADYTKNRWNSARPSGPLGLPKNVNRYKCGGYFARVTAHGVHHLSPVFEEMELADLAASEMRRRYHGDYSWQARAA